MKSTSILVIILAAVLAGCTPPHLPVAESAFGEIVKAQSQGKISVRKFEETNGQEIQINGAKAYQMSFRAEIEFKETGNWLSGSGRMTPVEFGFRAEQAPQGGLGGFMNTLSGGNQVNAGNVATITGSMTGSLMNNGWVFKVSESTIAASPKP